MVQFSELTSMNIEKQQGLQKQSDQIFNVIITENIEPKKYFNSFEMNDSPKERNNIEITLGSKILSVKKSQRKIYEKWCTEDQKIYWFGLMSMVEENPLVKHSWSNWKVDRCFKNMQVLFKGSKTNTQIKSFDQRMKKQYLKKMKIDIEDAICIALKQLRLSQYQLDKVRKFEKFHAFEKNIEKESKFLNFIKSLDSEIKINKIQIDQLMDLKKILMKKSF